MFVGMGVHTAELQESIARYRKRINVFITPVWISRHRRLTSSPSSLNQFRRFTYKSVNKSPRYKSCQSLYCPFSVTAAVVQFIFNLYLHVWLHNVRVLRVGSFVLLFPLSFCFKEEIATSGLQKLPETLDRFWASSFINLFKFSQTH